MILYRVAHKSAAFLVLVLTVEFHDVFAAQDGHDAGISNNLRSLGYYQFGNDHNSGSSNAHQSQNMCHHHSLNSNREFTFTALASGEQEQPPVGPVDTMTTGALMLQFDRTFTAAYFKIDVFNGQGIDRLHIHCGLPGIGGPVVVEPFNIQPEGVYSNGALCEGVITNKDIMDMDFLADERCGIVINNIASLFEAASRRSLYLNVHSTAYPDGIVRGQLLPDKH